MRKNRAKMSGSAECSACGYRAASVSVAFCPGCGRAFVPAKASPAPKRERKRIGWLSLPHMLYPRLYKWFVWISALDVVFTWFILMLGGQEVNVLADAVIRTGGLKGILIYKFSLVVFVVLACEFVGRRKPRVGRGLARLAVAITALPVILSIIQLFS